MAAEELSTGQKKQKHKIMKQNMARNWETRLNKIIALYLVVSLLALSPGVRADMLAPDALVKVIAQDVLSVVNQNNAALAGNQEAILRLVDAKVLPHFDFVRMTRLAVGKNWSKATPKQKNTLVAEFRNLLVNTYTNAFMLYRNQTVEVMPAEISAGVNEVTVKTLILEPGAKRITVDYEMEKTPDGWKVFDLTVEGVSLVVNYRSTFTREVGLG